MSSPASAAVHEVDAPPADPRTPRRVRHEPRRRTLTIKQVEKIAAHMIRVTLTGDLNDFTSLGFDDHIKLFFPDGTMNADGAPNALSSRFHAAPLRSRRQYSRDRFRHPRCWARDALGHAGPAWSDADHRRAARLLHHPERLRLASPDRRRNRAPRHITPARRTAAGHARGGAGRGRWTTRRTRIRDDGERDRHMGVPRRRRGWRRRCAGEGFGNAETSCRRLLCLGRVRVAHR